MTAVRLAIFGCAAASLGVSTSAVSVLRLTKLRRAEQSRVGNEAAFKP